MIEAAGDDVASDFAGLADRQAADGVSGEIHVDEVEGAFPTEVGIHAALDDAEEGLGLVEGGVPGDFVPVCLEEGFGAGGPGVGEVHGVAGAFPAGGGFDALVEGHEDVGAERDLDGDGVLGRKEVAGAIEVGAEVDAIGGDFAEFGEGEDLEAAGVGEHGAAPGHEAVDAAHAGDEVVTGAEVEMVGVGEDDLRAEAGGAEGFEDALLDGLDGCGGADWHEDWCFDDAVREVEAGSASAVGGGVFDLEEGGHIDECRVAVRGCWGAGRVGDVCGCKWDRHPGGCLFAGWRC